MAKSKEPSLGQVLVGEVVNEKLAAERISVLGAQEEPTLQKIASMEAYARLSSKYNKTPGTEARISRMVKQELSPFDEALDVLYGNPQLQQAYGTGIAGAVAIMPILDGVAKSEELRRAVLPKVKDRVENRRKAFAGAYGSKRIPAFGTYVEGEAGDDEF